MSGGSEQVVLLTARVRGRVQGVGYRFFAQRSAAALGLRGFVRNLPDGAVEVVAEGRRDAVELYLRRLWEGPYGARVDAVETSWGESSGTFSGFAITH